MASPASHMESEWQFEALDVEDVARWLRSSAVPGYTIVPGGVTDVTDTYFDTEDWRIFRAGFTCRVRGMADGAELTLKAMGEAAEGLRRRLERNQPLSTATTSAILSSEGDVAVAIRLISGRHEPHPLFTLEQRRQAFRFSDGEGALGEVSLDETSIPVEVEGGPVRMSRVEIEVVDTERARRFVEALATANGLAPAATGKFQAALMALDIGVTRPEETLGPTAVEASMSAGEVAFAVMRKQFGLFLANEGGTRLGDDIEALHDMRVAARRLRAAMSLFRAWLPVRMDVVRLEVGWVARALGDVRDLDVQIVRMEEWRSEVQAESAHAFEAVEEILGERRDAAREHLLTVLNSGRYEGLVERLAAMLRRGPAEQGALGGPAILAVAPDLIEKRYRRLRRKGDAIDAESPPETYHQLRIDGKKLRYALEFVGPVYGKPAVDFAGRLADLQDVLGLHQDAYVAIDMLEATVTEESGRLTPATIFAMGALAQRYRQQAAELRGRFPSVWRPMRRKQWKRLRRAMEDRRPGPRGHQPGQ